MTFEEIKSLVEENGDVKTVTMELLRDAASAGRLGRVVLMTITDELAGLGLGHVPTALPNSQTESVRLYKKGTLVGNLIKTVMSPGEGRDHMLVGHVSGGGSDYASIVAEIRELVCES